VYLVRSFRNSYRAANFCRAATIDNSVVDDHIADDADGVVQRSVGLIDDLPPKD
jgi:hypothetical protein